MEKKTIGDVLFSHTFHASLDKVYDIFTSPTLLPIIYQNLKIISMKRNTTLDDHGNEVHVLWKDKYNMTFKVDNVIKTPYYRTFTHKCTSTSSSVCCFQDIFHFYWNSIEKVTIFKFQGKNKDINKPSVNEDLLDNKGLICQKAEEYLSKTLTNLEEVESISINKNINDVWSFISNMNNQIYFYPQTTIAINLLAEDKVSIVDQINNNEMQFGIKRNDEKNRKALELTLISSGFPLPKQKIEINLIRMDKEKCFIMFKHIMLEYIPNDILLSYSSPKKKILKKIKESLENNKNTLSALI